jgi:hypothetical protein
MRYLAILLTLAGAFSAQATIISFDFEAFTPTYTAPPDSSRAGALTSLVLTGGGLTVTITRPNGLAFDLVSNTGDQAGKPASWGNVSLDPFFDPSNSGWILDFSIPVTSVAIQYGDYGQDSDSLTATAFAGSGGTGTNLGSTTDVYGTQAFPFYDTVTVNAIGINSVTLNGASDAPGFNNSAFLDNLLIDPPDPVTTPEPAGLTFMLLGFALIGALLIHRKRQSV